MLYTWGKFKADAECLGEGAYGRLEGVTYLWCGWEVKKQNIFFSRSLIAPVLYYKNLRKDFY